MQNIYNIFVNYFNGYQLPPIFISALFIWTIFWKGLALWRAAKYNQLNWFIALLILSTAGILEIVYLFFFAKEKLSLRELKSWYKEKFNR